MGRPPSIVEDYREWERRLERYQTHEVNLDVFCLQEGVSRSTFYRWKRRLDNGIPETLQADAAEPEQNGSTDALFLPISLKKSRIEIELPNGGVVRLPADVSQGVLMASRPRGRFLASLEGAPVMIEFSEIRVFLCTIPTKMNYSFDTLMGLAQQIFDEDPLSGHLFLFVNRQRDRLKILFWDHDGLAIFYKRLESGTFQLPRSVRGEQGIELDERQLNRLLTGLDLRTGRRRKRYRRVG